MTLEEIDNTLPEGLHDAKIRSFMRDLESAELTMFVKVVIGLSQEDKYRLLYRDGKICFHGVRYFVSEFPDAESTFRDSGCVGFNYNRAESGEIPDAVDKVLSKGVLRYSMFILEWQASMNIAAQEVSFTWSE